VRRRTFRVCLVLVTWLLQCVAASAQSAPAPSQVAPPVIAPRPGGGRIGIPQVPAGTTIPAESKKLYFKLLGFDIQGEFKELVAQRKLLEASLIGKRISVAQVFEFADALQQVYAKAGYPLARVVILPQEFEGIVENGHVKLMAGELPEGTRVQVRVKR